MDTAGLFLSFLTALQENSSTLNDLDQAIGDGDHGTNMVRGFSAVCAAKEKFEGKDIGQAFLDSAMILVSQVGGSSGPLVGTAFMKIGSGLKGKGTVSRQDLAACFKAAIEGIQMRGKAVRGEKTMLDVLIPASEYFETHLNSSLPELSEGLKVVCSQSFDATKDIIATKGRAAYLKERSLGHKDAGACSSMLLIGAALDYFNKS